MPCCAVNSNEFGNETEMAWPGVAASYRAVPADWNSRHPTRPSGRSSARACVSDTGAAVARRPAAAPSAFSVYTGS